MAQRLSARLPLLYPRFDSRVWVEVVVDFRPCSEGFSPGPWVFLLTQKPTFQLPIRDSSGLEKPRRGMSTAISHYDQFRGFFF